MKVMLFNKNCDLFTPLCEDDFQEQKLNVGNIYLATVKNSKMKLLLLNTTHGLMPMYDEDYDEKKKLKVGQVYEAEIKQSRNYMFHKKYFALIRCAWEFLPESTQEYFHNNITSFRKALEVAAGWYEEEYSLDRHEWYQRSKSISYNSMSKEEFDNLYSSVKDVLFKAILNGIITEEYFEQHLTNF